jgi:hypothetical protein
LGCTSEQEDFDILSRDMEDAGTWVQNVASSVEYVEWELLVSCFLSQNMRLPTYL